MGPLFMAAVVACRTLNNCVLNTVAKTRIKSRSGHYLFATIASAVALLFVIIRSGGIPEIEGGDISHGIILGILSIGEEFFLLSALECGSMAMTLVCAMTSFSLTNLASVPLFGHALNGLDWTGIVLSVACILVLMLDCCNKGILGGHGSAGINMAGTDHSTNSTREYVAAHGAADAHEAGAAHEKAEFIHWRKFALILLGLTALVEIEEKLHAETVVSENHMGYYFVAFLTATLFAGCLFLWRYKGKNEPTKFVWDWKFILMLIFCGIMKALIYIVVGLAAEHLTESLVAVINACALIAVLVVVDRLYFKTRLRWNQYLSAALAIISILLIW